MSDHMSFTALPAGATRDQLTCSDSSLAVDDSNLIIKALNLMRRHTNLSQYFAVTLDKVVPIQAGLGGGSGNAATAMYAFNALTGFPASNEDLKLWSGEIGSDITFFFSSGTAYCTGRGEIVTPLAPLPQAADTEVHIFKPREGLSTPLVFKTLDLSALHASPPEEILGAHVRRGALSAASSGLLVNDLEPPAFVCAPRLLHIKKDIAEQLLGSEEGGVMMSGSGTSVYALLRRTSDAAALARRERAVAALLQTHPDIKYFRTAFLGKNDDAKAWYAL